MVYPFLPSPNFTPRSQEKIEAIVIHCTCGNLEKTISWCLNPYSKESFHFIIALDGRIIQLVSIKNAAWHAGWATSPALPEFLKPNPNEQTIGIALEDSRNPACSENQTESLVALIERLKTECQLKLTPDRLLGHNLIDPERNSSDPGHYVDWDRLYRSVIEFGTFDEAENENIPEEEMLPSIMPDSAEENGMNDYVMENLIRKVFHGLLNRDPNVSEIDYYKHAGLDLSQITRRIITTEEFRNIQNEKDKSRMKVMNFLP